MRLASLLLLVTACGRLGFSETERMVDAAPDAEVLDERCDPLPTADTIALYSFEAALTTDATSTHDAIVVGAVATVEGACGTSAAQFDAGSHLIVPDSPAFDLAEGSLEFFARVPAPATGIQGLVSRDADNTDFDGHISIGVAASGTLFVRMQRAGGPTAFRCSAAPLEADRWIHVAVSFGPPGFRMWLDGIEAVGTSFDYDGAVADCTAPHTFGIDGNDNTFVVGALNHRAENSAPMPAITNPLAGAIDQLRIRSAWRDYSRSR